MDPSSTSLSLLESIGEGSTAGYISERADHWAIEAFIPVQPHQWTECLIQHTATGCSIDLPADQFRDAADQIERWVQRHASSQQRAFAAVYQAIDPDRDTRDLMPLEIDEEDEEQVLKTLQPKINAAMDLMSNMLDRAGYQRLSQEAIEQCVGVASQWGVPLHVDFNLFDQLIVYARGDIIGTRFKRRLRKLYRREPVEVPIYQRMVVMFRLKQNQEAGETLAATSLHLRMFKNIPKQDIDMLLPGSRIKLSRVDRVRIVLPSLGGFLMSIRKIASYALLFAVLALHWTAILVVLIIGYLVKSTMSYFQTKNRYQLNLNRNLYFQKLDTGAGVGFHVLSQAAGQMQVELTLAYYAICTNEDPISTRKLRRKCERIVREVIDIEIDFQIDRTLQTLKELNLVTECVDGWSTAGAKPASQVP